jgi:hypothetical protein
MLPDSAAFLEQFAKGRDRSAVTAGRPLRDGGYSRLCLALGSSKRGQCERGGGSDEQTTPCCDWHSMFLPVSEFGALAASLPLKKVMDFRVSQRFWNHAAQPPTGRRASRQPAA